jgi:hypothetical protein
MKKEKEKGFRLWWAGGNPAQPGAGRARARLRRPSYGPWRETARAREGRRRFRGAHVPERVGGGDAPTVDGAGRTGRPLGRKPAAGGLDGDSPLSTRFLGNG